MVTKSKLLTILGIILAILLMVWLKVYLNSMVEYRRAERAFLSKDYQEAIDHYQRSIHWYLPVNKYVSRSAARLWEIGSQAETEGEEELALRAYRILRSSFYAVRSFYTPGQDWIERCNEKIADLVARQEPYSAEDREKPVEERKEEVLEVLRKKSRPDLFWSFMVELGFFGWVGSTIGFIFRSFGSDNRFKGKRALFWGSLIIVFYALWVVGIVNA